MFDLKKKGTLSPVEKDAKSSVIEHMRQMAEDMMGDKLKGLKQVTVASDDPKGLAEGLAKAKAMVAHKPGEDADAAAVGDSDAADLDADKTGDSDGADMNEDAHEGDEHEMPEHGDDMAHMSEDEIDQKLQELMALKEKMAKAKV